MLLLWKLNSHPTRLLRKFILKASTVGKKMTLMEGHLPSQLQLVTSVGKRTVFKGIENTIEMVLMRISLRLQQESFQKWVTKRDIVSDLEYLTKSTMKLNNRDYKWCMYCNTNNCSWVFHWNVVHKDLGGKKVKKEVGSIC